MPSVVISLWGFLLNNMSKAKPLSKLSDRIKNICMNLLKLSAAAQSSYSLLWLLLTSAQNTTSSSTHYFISYIQCFKFYLISKLNSSVVDDEFTLNQISRKGSKSIIPFREKFIVNRMVPIVDDLARSEFLLILNFMIKLRKEVII